MKAPNPLGEFEQIVLLAILRLQDDAYGVTIREEIHACTGRVVAPGAIYTTLERLEQKDLVTVREGEPTAQRGGRARRLYRLTPAGRNALTAAQLAFQQLLRGLNLLGEQHG